MANITVPQQLVTEHLPAGTSLDVRLCQTVSVRQRRTVRAGAETSLAARTGTAGGGHPMERSGQRERKGLVTFPPFQDQSVNTLTSGRRGGSIELTQDPNTRAQKPGGMF